MNLIFIIREIRIFCLILIAILFLPATILAQGPEDYNEDGEVVVYSKKGLHAGLFVGSYFPNSYSANYYDGYGFDFEGNRNTFENSWMYQKIVIQYGGYGGTGNPDYIAEELGIPHEDWNFKEDDMPSNMRFKTAFSIGFNGRYSVDGKSAIIFNANASIIKAAGNFTLTTRPTPGSTQINNSIKTFNISGEEQRLLFQVGFQRLLGDGEGMQLFVEGGLHATLAKFAKNEIQIENLIIDLYQEYYDPVNGYTFFAGSRPVGLGFGAFAGLGVHIETNSKWNLQFVYNPMLENVRIGYDPKLKISHALGLRAYYKLAKK